MKENYHAAYPDQRFAYDILNIRDGTSHTGEGKENSDYFCFEKPIVSPGAGVVVEAVDGIADNVPGKMNPAQPCGNHLVIDLGEKEFLFLAHFKNGSLKVKAGDHVQPGQPLGLCGNSGNSSEPHLHVHLQTTPIFGAGKGLPLQFQHYLADGKPIERGEPTKGQAISNRRGQELNRSKSRRPAIHALTFLRRRNAFTNRPLRVPGTTPIRLTSAAQRLQRVN